MNQLNPHFIPFKGGILHSILTHWRSSKKKFNWIGVSPTLKMILKFLYISKSLIRGQEYPSPRQKERALEILLTFKLKHSLRSPIYFIKTRPRCTKMQSNSPNLRSLSKSLFSTAMKWTSSFFFIYEYPKKLRPGWYPESRQNYKKLDWWEYCHIWRGFSVEVKLS